MRRKALLRDGEGFVVLEESDFGAEKALQEALERYPETIPVADLELDHVIVVGRETSLPAGSIDILLVDARGRVIIVETKLSQNPELRRQIVAQLLDYGASLWKAVPTVKAFEKLVLGYWKSDSCQDPRLKETGSLREGIDLIFNEFVGEDWDYDTFEEALADNLASGQHVLLMVASGLMDGLSRDLLQYANICLSLPLYGVEISMFNMGDKELIVPRGVRHIARKSGAGAPSPPHANLPDFLEACTPLAKSFFEGLLSGAVERDLVTYWGLKGFSVRMPLEPHVTVMRGYPPRKFQIYLHKWPLDAAAEEEFRRRLAGLAPFSHGGQYGYTLQLTETTDAEARAALKFVWDKVDEMMAASQEGP